MHAVIGQINGQCVLLNSPAYIPAFLWVGLKQEVRLSLHMYEPWGGGGGLLYINILS